MQSNQPASPNDKNPSNDQRIQSGKLSPEEKVYDEKPLETLRDAIRANQIPMYK
jgi:hypothetical protein